MTDRPTTAGIFAFAAELHASRLPTADMCARCRVLRPDDPRDDRTVVVPSTYCGTCGAPWRRETVR